VLNRLAYGPSPEDFEAVRRDGVAAWIRSQMAPASVPDGAVEAKLRGLATLSMSIAAMQETYPRPNITGAASLAKGRPDRKEKTREAVDPVKPRQVIGRELATQKLVRAVESRRQLQEVLTDFWFNHFNVFGGKGEDRWMITAYERDAIRRNVFGSFRAFLEATARHPAMLFYLDNWTSTREGLGGNPSQKKRGGLNENYARELLELHTLGVDGGYTQQDVREVARCFTGWSIVRPRGGNAQGPLAKIDAGAEPGTFVFRAFAHDDGEKVVLGHAIPAGGGIRDGERVLDILASHPATARFVAKKLCMKFVSDEPPAALVNRVAAAFLKKQGDLPSVYAALFSSPEFWSDTAWASKTKTPLELAVSAVRAVGGRVRADVEPVLAREIGRMGEPLYQCQPPTGYKETAAEWVNTGSLLNRLNFCIALAAGRVRGIDADVSRALGIAPGDAPGAAVDRAVKVLLHTDPSPSTRAIVLKALSADNTPDPIKMAGLLLGSPEFQKQ
jgi:uncharacterized protein (DUF1800 family)